MTAFAAWLHDNQSNDPALVRLKAFAVANAARWPYWSDEAIDYIGAIRATNPALPPADETALISAVVNYYALWKSGLKSQGVWSLLFGNLGKIVLVIFGIYFAYLLQKGLLLETLNNADQVRGMVTFFFVLVTTSVILLVALGIFWLQDDNAVKVRFEAAKDLLTIVIGVLGTIMGFYFGSATTGTANLALLSTSLTPPSVAAGESATLASQISGGSKPYKYSIVFTDPTGAVTPAQLKTMNVAATDSADGKIEKKIAVPADAKSAVLFFTLTATDSKNTSTQNGGALFVEKKP